MAIRSTRLVAALLTGADEVEFTVPEGRTLIVKRVTAVNRGATQATLDVVLVTTEDPTTPIVLHREVLAVNAAYDPRCPPWWVVRSGETVRLVNVQPDDILYVSLHGALLEGEPS